MSLVLGNTLLLVMVLIEIFILARVKKEQIPWKEIIFNLNSGHILLWIFRGLEIASLHFISTNYSFNIINEWNYLFQWIFTFIAWDFCFYWFHRLHHKYKYLWAVHVVHHEGEHFSLSLGIRNSWYSQITAFPFFVILAFGGLPIEIYLGVSSIHYFFQFYNHNSLIKNSGWLDKIMITPKHHKVHHGKNDYCINKNFGSILIIWDKIFGTFQLENKDDLVQVGTSNYKKNYDPIYANNNPFIKKEENKTSKNTSKKIKAPNYIIFSGGIALFVLLLSYIYFEEIWSNQHKLILFTIVFLGTIANGNMMEGKKWASYLWIFIFSFLFLFSSLFIFNFNLFTISISILMVIHSIIVAKNIYSKR